MSELVPSFRETLFSPTYEIAVEYAEIDIDALLDSDALKVIPVVGTISAICKVGYNLHERNLIKQTLAFINGFNAGTAPREKIEEHKYSLENDSCKAEKELGRVLIILGNHIEDVQSQVLGSFYKAYIKGAISWAKFCELSEANRRMFISDYGVLREAARKNGLMINDRELYQVDRLISLGLLQNLNRQGSNFYVNIDKTATKESDIIITSFGKTFCQHFPPIENVL